MYVDDIGVQYHMYHTAFPASSVFFLELERVIYFLCMVSFTGNVATDYKIPFVAEPPEQLVASGGLAGHCRSI